MKKFDFVQMLEAVQKFKISNLIMVPPIVVVRFLPISVQSLFNIPIPPYIPSFFSIDEKRSPALKTAEIGGCGWERRVKISRAIKS